MALKKSELYSSLWASCDELRGGMDASQYKDYVLVLLFVKYVSDRYAEEPYAPISIPKGASFADMVALKGKTDIGDQINKKILGPLAQANKLSDMPDFNDPNKLGSGKEMVERLTNLIAIFENPALDFSKNRADGDDLLGDAYEYLMRHFATESGKSKGQFYTPAEVSRVIAQILGIRYAKKITNDTTVYDPTCGSGSLLLKVGDEAGHGHQHLKVTLYGQEKDIATAGLARMNRDQAGQHHRQPALPRRRRAQNLRLRRRQSTIQRQALEHRPRCRARPLAAFPALRHPARQAGRLRLPPAHPPLAQEHRQRRVHSPARRAVSWWCRRCHPPQPCAAGLPERHHRPAAEPLLRHRYPRLHCGARQGRCELP
jgi:N-6 DNA Methylase/HsdM N-terminal domain